MSKTLVDPPEGWKYGFPKKLPPELKDKGDLTEWLVREGYPQSEIKRYGKYFSVRFIEEVDNIKTINDMLKQHFFGAEK